MAEEQKPVLPTETPAADPVPAVAETTAVEPLAEQKAGEPAATTETPAAAETTEAAAATEEAPKPAEEKKEAEPVYSGALGYKAPGLVKGLIFSKKYFWFGEEPVSTQKLSHYLRGEKPEIAHPTAAWSSQTGKGLLYFVKHADQKETPAGVLNLSEVENVNKEGGNEFSFKLNGHKHTFQASNAAERDGWVLALNKAVEDAKASREEIIGSAGYKEEIEKLGKPALLAAAGSSSAPKKSTEVKPATEGEPIARTGSSSSSSDEDKKKKKAKSKSRSVSRGKRASIFGSLLGKKEEQKKEEQAEAKPEAAEEKKEGETATAEPTAAVAATEAPLDAPAVAERAIEAPVVPAAEENAVASETAPATASVAAEPAAATAETTETPKAPKPTKRQSIFGNFVEKLRSPTSEKKESEILPTVPPKDKEETVAPAAEEIPAAAPIAAEETPAAIEAPATTEAPAAAAPATTPEVKEKRRTSFFGNLGGSVKKTGAEGEKAPSKLSGLFRNPSKAVKSNKEKEATPAKTEETPETVPEVPAAEETKPAEPAAEPAAPAAEPASIGDVVPDAVTVGQASKSTPPVTASA